jgi:hypothetical protein
MLEDENTVGGCSLRKNGLTKAYFKVDDDDDDDDDDDETNYGFHF